MIKEHSAIIFGASIDINSIYSPVCRILLANLKYLLIRNTFVFKITFVEYRMLSYTDFILYSFLHSPIYATFFKLKFTYYAQLMKFFAKGKIYNLLSSTHFCILVAGKWIDGMNIFSN